jgi:hypothetical protein
MSGFFRVIPRGCPLLTLGDPPKMLRDKSREGSPLEPSKSFDKKGLFKNNPRECLTNTRETTLHLNAFINITTR